MTVFLRRGSALIVTAFAVFLAWTPGPPHFDAALILFATLAAWVFCALYALLSHGAWIRTKYGRHLMVLTVGLALLGTHRLGERLLGPWDWGVLGDTQAHREIIYLILGWQLFNRCVLLVVSHIRGEKRRKAELLRPVRYDETPGQRAARGNRARHLSTEPY